MAVIVKQSDHMTVCLGSLDECMMVADKFIKLGYRLAEMKPNLHSPDWYVVLYSDPQTQAAFTMMSEALETITNPPPDAGEEWKN